MGVVKDIWMKIDYIFTKGQKKQLIGMVVLLILEACIELLGVVSIYPSYWRGIKSGNDTYEFAFEWGISCVPCTEQ